MEHTSWIKHHSNHLTKNNKTVNVFEFKYKNDDTLLNDWAMHFRKQYCSNDDLISESKANNMTPEEYLMKIKFPSKNAPPGPSIRSGDFSEILVADYLQYILDYLVPRTRYDGKTIANESTKGCDIIAFKVGQAYIPEDEMLIVEVKAQLSGSGAKNRLQDAIDDSQKDSTRLAESLNAIKQRLKMRGDLKKAQIVERFQNITDTPYRCYYGAASVFSNDLFDTSLICDTTTENNNNQEMMLMVIKGENLMNIVHDIYRRASLC